VNREASSSAFAVELTTITPSATTDDIISAPTWRFIFFSAAMGYLSFRVGLQLSNPRRLRALLRARTAEPWSSRTAEKRDAVDVADHRDDRVRVNQSLPVRSCFFQEPNPLLRTALWAQSRLSPAADMPMRQHAVREVPQPDQVRCRKSIMWA
jgi:hypothetical protein